MDAFVQEPGADNAEQSQGNGQSTSHRSRATAVKKKTEHAAPSRSKTLTKETTSPRSPSKQRGKTQKTKTIALDEGGSPDHVRRQEKSKKTKADVLDISSTKTGESTTNSHQPVSSDVAPPAVDAQPSAADNAPATATDEQNPSAELAGASPAHPSSPPSAMIGKKHSWPAAPNTIHDQQLSLLKEDSAVRLQHKTKAIKRPIWTGLLVVTWILVFIVVIISHMAIAKIVPPIEDLPTNFIKGFNETLGFRYIEADGKKVKLYAKRAMDLCLVGVASACGSVAHGVHGSKTADASSFYADINAAFDHSLKHIQEITTDKCIESSGFGSAATSTTKIKQKLSDLAPNQPDCNILFPAYCEIYDSGKVLVSGAQSAIKAIDDMANAEGIKKMTDAASNLKAMHVLPWVLVLSMVFFTIFWAHNGGVCCCCKGGSVLGCCCLLLPHVILLFVYLLLACIIVGIGYAFKIYAADEKPKGISRCSVSETIDHLELNYPSFYNLVLKDLIEGCLKFFNASQAAVGICVIISCYALCVCLCRPYSPKGNE